MVSIGKKISLTIISFLACMLMGVTAYCQCDGSPGLPGDPDDPGSTANCPLDTWVFIMAFIALAYVVWKMYKQQKPVVN